MSTKLGKTIMVIPDGQVRPGVPLQHWDWIANYIVEKKPDAIINIGDFGDLRSLNSYDEGKAAAEGTRYKADIEAVQTAMSKLMTPLRAVKGYNPILHMTLGNHEDRITRFAEAHPKLIGTMSVNDLGYEKWGWKVHPFLKVVKVFGWEFCHYFTSGVKGLPVSSAAALLRTRQCSAVMGHVQTTDMNIHQKTGKIGIFCGICYLHDEAYLTPQGNNTRRQVLMLHEVHDGVGDPMFVSLRWLRSNYS